MPSKAFHGGTETEGSDLWTLLLCLKPPTGCPTTPIHLTMSGQGMLQHESTMEEPVDASPVMTFMRFSTSSGELVDESALLEDDLMSSLVPRQNPGSEDYGAFERASKIMRQIGHLVGTVTILTMLILVPSVIIHAASEKRTDRAAFDSAAVMVIGTVILSVRLVYLHFTHWYMPDCQKYVVRILWMVPLYSVQSWLSLVFHGARIYIDSIRDLYEAYVIASFVYYLIELLGGQDALVRILERKRTTNPHLGEHSFPLSLVLQPWELGMEFMLQCKHGVLQYVVVKTIATVFTFFFQSIGMLGEGQFNWRMAYPYMILFMNTSVMYALYCLVKIFHAINDELCSPVNWRPLGKFLCIKGVVFFTWWQGVVIYYLRAHGVIADIGTWKADEVANGLIDYCICIEMVFFAIAHSYTFTYTEYLPSNFPASSEQTNGDYQPPTTLTRPMRFKDAFWSSTVPNDTLSDIQRLRSGVDNAMSLATNPGAISLQDIQANEEEVDARQTLV